MRSPRGVASAYLSPDEVVAIARAGVEAGCQEALFTLGDKPELVYEAALRALARLGYQTTLDYLDAMCALVLRETCLLPHFNPGVMREAGIARCATNPCPGSHVGNPSAPLRAARRPAHASPDKVPAVRLKTIEEAGRLGVPFTTGILIGIGESLEDRIDSLLAIERCISNTAISRKSSSRTSAPSPKSAWPIRPSPARTITCGPSPLRGCVCAT